MIQSPAHMRLQQVADGVKSAFVGRDDVVEYLQYSLIARSHLLLIGPPGAAKSAIFGDFLARLQCQRGFFSLPKDSTPETLAGLGNLGVGTRNLLVSVLARTGRRV